MKTQDLFNVDNDMYCNPRVVVHFSCLLTEKENNELSIDAAYNLAHKRALRLGGKIYRGKEFGGGFVFQCYYERQLVESINNMLSKL